VLLMCHCHGFVGAQGDLLTAWSCNQAIQTLSVGQCYMKSVLWWIGI
jgi:hypothetical protein